MKTVRWEVRFIRKNAVALLTAPFIFMSEPDVSAASDVYGRSYSIEYSSNDPSFFTSVPCVEMKSRKPK